MLLYWQELKECKISAFMLCLQTCSSAYLGCLSYSYLPLSSKQSDYNNCSSLNSFSTLVWKNHSGLAVSEILRPARLVPTTMQHSKSLTSPSCPILMLSVNHMVVLTMSTLLTCDWLLDVCANEHFHRFTQSSGW